MSSDLLIYKEEMQGKQVETGFASSEECNLCLSGEKMLATGLTTQLGREKRLLK